MKNIQRFAPIKYNDYFPISTVLNAAISGATVEAILYRVERMNLPKSVSNISLLCRTNNLASTSPSVISATIIKNINCNLSKMPNCYHSCVSHFTTVRSWCNDRFWPICSSGIIEDEFHFLFHCPRYSIPREKFYNQIQQNFADFNQLSYTELIINLMYSQNFSVNSHLLKFVSLCNDLHTNLLSNHADDTWLTVVIIALHYHYYKLLLYVKAFAIL